MKNVELKKSYIFLSLLVLFLMITLLLNPKICFNSVLNGLSVWLNSVVPALFPFLFLTKLLTNLKFVEVVSKKLEKVTKKLFNVSGIGSYVFLMSLMSGYPVGAKLVSELFCAGKITHAEAMRMNSFCSTSGPIFVVGTIGFSLFGDYKLGVIILLAHIFGAVLNGIIFRFYKKNELSHTLNVASKNQNIDNILANTMYDSIISILTIGGFITLFFVFVNILLEFHILSFASYFLSCLFNFLGINPNISNAVTSGIFEMTFGCKELATSGAGKILTATTCCALISFGGLSIHLQSLAFLQKCKIKIGLYFLMKTTQSVISAFLAFLLACLIF